MHFVNKGGIIKIYFRKEPRKRGIVGRHMMSEFIWQVSRVEEAMEEKLRKYEYDLKNFPKPEDFYISIPKGFNHEVIDLYKSKGWKYVKGGPEDDCDYLRFK